MFAPDVTQEITTTVVWLSVAVALLAMNLVPALMQHFHRRSTRAEAIEQMSPLRIVRMLAFRHLPLQQFVAQLTPGELSRTIASCRGCTNAARCEAVLQGYLPANDYAFCPSRDTIGRAAQLVAPSRT